MMPPPKTTQQSGFIDEAEIHPNDDGETFTVVKTFTFVSKTGNVIVVPKDFTTALASLPDLARVGALAILAGLILRFLEWRFLFGVENLLILVGFVVVWFSGWLHHRGRYTTAAILLDWLYGTRPFARSYCDQLFHEALTECHTDDLQRVVLYHAVRVWGIYAWRKDSPHRSIPAVKGT